MIYLRVGQMIVGERGFFKLKLPSNVPRGGENTSHDRSTLMCVENREI